MNEHVHSTTTHSESDQLEEGIMEAKTSSIITTLCRMQGFLNKETAVAAGLETARQRLDAAATALTALVAAQNECTRGGIAVTTRLNALREQIRTDHMRPIAEIANRKVLAGAQRASFELPASGSATPGLIAAAYAMSSAVTPHVNTFIVLGLPPGFAVQLRRAADSLSGLLEQRRQYMDTRVAATFGLVRATEEGRTVVKLMDALVRSRVRGNAAMLEAWNAVARGEKGVRGPRGRRALKLV